MKEEINVEEYPTIYAWNKLKKEIKFELLKEWATGCALHGVDLDKFLNRGRKFLSIGRMIDKLEKSGVVLFMSRQISKERKGIKGGMWGVVNYHDSGNIIIKKQLSDALLNLLILYIKKD